MTINERIKHIRKTLNLTQIQFAESIGIDQSTISYIESGKTKVIDERSIRLISGKHNINDEWIRTGKGQMFSSAEGDLLGLLNAKLPQLDEMDKKILIEYLKLNGNQRKIIKEYIKNIRE